MLAGECVCVCILHPIPRALSYSLDYRTNNNLIFFIFLLLNLPVSACLSIHLFIYISTPSPRLPPSLQPYPSTLPPPPASPVYLFLVTQYDDLSWLQKDIDMLFKKEEDEERGGLIEGGKTNKA